jgi:CBS domain-containing protein
VKDVVAGELRVAALVFADQLRSAREAALKDAEAFDGIIHAVERLGSFLSPKSENLGQYKCELEKIASTSAMAEEVPKSFRNVLTPFSLLFDLVKDARNDALHQGAFARHLTGHAIELALILEDALRRSETPPVVSDYMVRNPVCAELWQPIGFIRQQMLANSFSFLPVLNKRGRWCLLSDRAIVTYLGANRTERKKLLASPLVKAPQVKLKPARCVMEETALQDALRYLKDAPLLVCGEGDPKRLLGIVTAFDLL